jgi:hypothetical protein
MGNRLIKFEFCPEENEQLEACIIVPKEKRSVIHGIVKNHEQCVVKDAVVIIFEIITIHGENILKPIGHAFTDDHGQFIFGPLCPERHYLVKVWINEIKIKKICISPPPGNECEHDHPIDNCRPCSDEFINKDENIVDNIVDKDSHWLGK